MVEKVPDAGIDRHQFRLVVRHLHAQGQARVGQLWCSWTKGGLKWCWHIGKSLTPRTSNRSIIVDIVEKFNAIDLSEYHAHFFNCKATSMSHSAVLRIRDVYPGSEYFPFRSRIQICFIPDPGSASKNLSILTQKLFLSSRKYDSDCSSRIRIPDTDPNFLPIPNPGSRDKKRHRLEPGSGSATLPECYLTFFSSSTYLLTSAVPICKSFQNKQKQIDLQHTYTSPEAKTTDFQWN